MLSSFCGPFIVIHIVVFGFCVAFLRRVRIKLSRMERATTRNTLENAMKPKSSKQETKREKKNAENRMKGRMKLDRCRMRLEWRIFISIFLNWSGRHKAPTEYIVFGHRREIDRRSGKTMEKAWIRNIVACDLCGADECLRQRLHRSFSSETVLHTHTHLNGSTAYNAFLSSPVAHTHPHTHTHARKQSMVSIVPSLDRSLFKFPFRIRFESGTHHDRTHTHTHSFAIHIVRFTWHRLHEQRHCYSVCKYVQQHSIGIFMELFAENVLAYEWTFCRDCGQLCDNAKAIEAMRSYYYSIICVHTAISSSMSPPKNRKEHILPSLSRRSVTTGPRTACTLLGEDKKFA